MHERRVKLGYCILFLLLILLTAASLTIGNYNDLSGNDVFQVLLRRLTGKKLTISNTAAAIVWNIRIPRTVSAILIGAALSTAGCCYQEIFQNDLASPDILGVSSGACVGAALGIILGVSSSTIQLWAFFHGSRYGSYGISAIWCISWGKACFSADFRDPHLWIHELDTGAY